MIPLEIYLHLIHNIPTNTPNIADLFTLKLGYDSCSNFHSIIDTVSLLDCLDSAFSVVHPENGISPYSYFWSTSPPTLDSISSFDNTGMYNITVTDGNGCVRASSIEINKQYIDTTQNITTCDSSFISPSGNYNWTTDGTYNDTLQSNSSCDTIITINLTFDTTHFDTIATTACVFYTAPSNTILTSSGTYSDTLYSNYGCSTITTIYLTITPSINTSNFTFIDNGSGNYSFSNTSTGSYNQSHWAFGDGTTSIMTNPNHTFTTNGTFVVVLTINDSTISGGNCFDYYIDTITITSVPTPLQCSSGFVMYPDTGVNNVTVVNSSTGSNLTYHWDFGDGDTSNLANPIHTYTGNGPYYLCLTVDDGTSCNNTYCDSVGVNGVVFKQSGFTINIIGTPIITGLDNHPVLNSDITIYPNPTSHQLTIDTELKLSKITIIDITGKIIMITKENKRTINVTNLSDGIYFIKLNTDQKTIIKKFVKH